MDLESAAELTRHHDPATPTHIAKDELRHQVRQARLATSIEDRLRADTRRTAVVLGLLDEQSVTTVACYVSRPPEPDTTELLAELVCRGHRVIVPRLSAERDQSGRRPPDWAEYTGPDDLSPGRFGIAEPTTPALGIAGLGLADVIILPALAVAPDGTRLGTGGGWVDRALPWAGAQSQRWVLLNDAEIVDHLPAEAHDEPVDLVITPTGSHVVTSRL